MNKDLFLNMFPSSSLMKSHRILQTKFIINTPVVLILDSSPNMKPTGAMGNLKTRGNLQVQF